MGTGYTRNDVSNNIADGNIINASDLDGEFDAVESAFNSSTGHTHDGTAAEGGAITVVGPVQDLVVSATEVKPKTTNTLDLGTSGLLYKDAYLQGNMYFRDTALKIVSSADGQLDIDADVELELVAPTVDIDASTAVTVDTASTTFTSTVFNVTGSANITGDLDVDNINIDGNTIISTDTNGAINITPNGTGAVNITATTNITGDLDVDNININGNTIISTDTNGDINISPDGTGTVVIDTDLDVDNININGNTISSTDTNGNINLVPNGTGVVNLTDNDKLTFGSGSDLQIYHDGGTSVIADTGTGNLQLRANDFQLVNAAATQNIIRGYDATGAVGLHYGGAEKLATTATGVNVTGTVTADGLTVDTNTLYVDSTNNRVGIGTSSPSGILQVETSGTAANVYVTSDISTSALASRISLGNSTSSARFTFGLLGGGGEVAYLGSEGPFPLYFQTAGTERLRIDSSGNVGIGTSSPARKVQIDGGASDAVIQFTNTNTGSTSVDGTYVGHAGTGTDFQLWNYETGYIRFGTSGTERMRIDSSGNVGINNTSPGSYYSNSNQLVVGSGAARQGITIASSTSTIGQLAFADGTSGDARYEGWVIYDHNTDHMSLGTSAEERLRIDSSGNLLVGTTDTVPSNNGAGGDAGVAISPDGVFRAARSGNVSLDINRMDSDGDIAAFRKDGTTVGSIGNVGSYLQIDTNLYSGLFLGSGAVFPKNNGSLSDNVNSLGSSSYRWKDLYLSGGVYLGGTAAANLLDDYEEGDYDVTITPSTSGSVTLNTSYNRASYTKVGRLVTVNGFLIVSSVASPVGYFNVNLPFTVASLTDRAGDSVVNLLIQNVSSANVADFVGAANEGNASFYVQLGDGTTTQNDSAQEILANTYITFSVTYPAA